MDDNKMIEQEISKSINLLNAYRDLVQDMVVPMQDMLEEYFNMTSKVEKEYFYAIVKSSTKVAKRINQRISQKQTASLDIWQHDNKVFEKFIDNLQTQLARMGYGVDIKEDDDQKTVN